MRRLLFLIVSVAVGFAQQPAPTPVPPFSPGTKFTSNTQKVLATVTVPIRIFCDKSQIATATGFFYDIDGKQLFLVTNRHVVIQEPEAGKTEPKVYPDHLVLRLHTSDNDLTKSEDVSVPLYANGQRLWREIDPSIDVVAVEITKIVTSKYYLGTFSKENLLPSDVPLSLGDPLVVIGYPLGLSDQMFNLPIAREGTVASVFPVPFQGKRLFLVDAKLHPGTSGSPVITRPSQWFFKNGRAMYNATEPVSYLVGINSGELGSLNLNGVWFANIILDLTK
jgi:S1-C subfamily serine protease